MNTNIATEHSKLIDLYNNDCDENYWKDKLDNEIGGGYSDNWFYKRKLKNGIEVYAVVIDGKVVCIRLDEKKTSMYYEIKNYGKIYESKCSWKSKYFYIYSRLLTNNLRYSISRTGFDEKVGYYSLFDNYQIFNVKVQHIKYGKFYKLTGNLQKVDFAGRLVESEYIYLGENQYVKSANNKYKVETYIQPYDESDDESDEDDGEKNNKRNNEMKNIEQLEDELNFRLDVVWCFKNLVNHLAFDDKLLYMSNDEKYTLHQDGRFISTDDGLNFNQPIDYDLISKYNIERIKVYNPINKTYYNVDKPIPVINLALKCDNNNYYVKKIIDCNHFKMTLYRKNGVLLSIKDTVTYRVEFQLTKWVLTLNNEQQTVEFPNITIV